jgi:hypothetical protein
VASRNLILLIDINEERPTFSNLYKFRNQIKVHVNFPCDEGYAVKVEEVKKPFVIVINFYRGEFQWL